MSKTTTFGYEQENGAIHYIITHNMTIDDAQKYLIHKITPSHGNKIFIVDSIDEYFDHDHFTKDESILRIAYMIDGTVRLRRCECMGEFIFVN
jgi:hypothetical protein